MRRSRSRSEAGSISVLATGILVVAGVLCLASVDLLRVVQAQARGQAAADATALAAAQELAMPSREGTPSDVAATFAAANGAELVNCVCEPGSSEAVAEVRMAVPLVFVWADRTVTARARAVVGSG